MNKRYCSVNNWLIDLPSGSILHLATGERKRLGEYQLKLLDILMQDAGRIFTREELTNLVWERRVIGNNSLPNAIHALRTALEDDGKQQKIIKTIPKKGYLLEPEYCRVIEKEESEVDVPPEALPLPEVEPDTPEETVAEASPVVMDEEVQSAVKESAPPVLANRTTFVLIVVLAVVCSALLTWWLVKRNDGDHLTAKEVQPNVYSNIRLYAIEPSGELSYSADNLYSKLKDSLYTLNQQVKTQSVTMTVYFSNKNFVLNYTFALTSPCDKRQLVMAIYHWRLDSNQLNNLILRETRRKLNEMATCTES
ncbi:winged helix-turn-helix domain-containing protein [Pseudocitrobacter cyperus]|uniref:Winged helix-turn-helix domain-containing protein n=1 Tax=Pseudocitrobacter cyperus TaxID=3112843 RepID=A0ABV0HIM6_9ENTR